MPISPMSKTEAYDIENFAEVENGKAAGCTLLLKAASSWLGQRNCFLSWPCPLTDHSAGPAARYWRDCNVACASSQPQACRSAPKCPTISHLPPPLTHSSAINGNRLCRHPDPISSLTGGAADAQCSQPTAWPTLSRGSATSPRENRIQR